MLCKTDNAVSSWAVCQYVLRWTRSVILLKADLDLFFLLFPIFSSDVKIVPRHNKYSTLGNRHSAMHEFPCHACSYQYFYFRLADVQSRRWGYQCRYQLLVILRECKTDLTLRNPLHVYLLNGLLNQISFNERSRANKTSIWSTFKGYSQRCINVYALLICL